MCSRAIWRVWLRNGRLLLVWASGLASRPAAQAAIWLGAVVALTCREPGWLAEAREGGVGDGTVPSDPAHGAHGGTRADDPCRLPALLPPGS